MTTRVLVVDDSAFARKVLREVLGADSSIEVVGVARDGLDALEKIAELRPDVVTLDLVMPELDGLGVLRALRERRDAPRVVIVTMTDEDSDIGVAALREGAFEVVHKPTAIATDRLYELGAELRAKVLAAAAPGPAVEEAPPSLPPRPRRALGLMVVGASTGGPSAVSRLLAGLPKSFPLPIAVAIHMPVGYTAAFAARLDQECALDVFEAHENLELLPGRVAIARGGMHLKVAPGPRAQLDVLPLTQQHRPSVDVLFESAAALGPALGVVLTGMGRDGAEGAAAIRSTGGIVLTESASSCVVYGMPRAVLEAGASDGQAPIEALAGLVMASV